MRSIYLKNILSLLKNTGETISILCQSSDTIIINILDNTEELLFHFELNSRNTLIIGKTYIVCLSDLHKIFKFVVSEALVVFSDDYSNLNIKIFSSLHLQTEIKLPLLYKEHNNLITQTFEELILDKPYFISVKISDFSRIIKSLKNTSSNYAMSFNNKALKIENIEAVIPISYSLTSLSDTTFPSSIKAEAVLNLSNNCLLRLNKLSVTNKNINVYNHFITSSDEDIKYYILFIPQNE